MKRLIAAEIEYLKKRWFWAMAVSGGPLAIFAGIIYPIFLKGNSIDEFLIPFIFAWSIMFALFALIGAQGMRVRSEIRLKVHMMLPVKKSDVAMAQIVVRVAAIGMLYLPLVLLLLITGYQFVDNDLIAILLINGVMLGIYFSVSLTDQVGGLKLEKAFFRYSLFPILILFLPTTALKGLVDQLQKFHINASYIVSAQVGIREFFGSQPGVITLNVLALALPLVTYILFMVRKSYVTK